MNHLKLTRQKLTSYYVAIMIATNLFTLLPKVLVNWVTWLISFSKNTLSIEITSAGGVWICFFLVCLFIVWILRKFIVEPLGFYVNGTASSLLETLILGFFILGFFIFSINRLFPEYPMPSTLPDFFLRLFGSFGNVNYNSLEQRNVWSIVPWLWYFGPIAVMYSMFINEKMHQSSEEGK
jgi:hypothetical protein